MFLLSHGFIADVYCLLRGQAVCVLVCEYHDVCDKRLPSNTIARSKNCIALFSTTGIQHRLTDRIAYLLEVSSYESIISRRYHPKTSFPLYTDSITDCCSGSGLSSGLSNCWRTYERQSGSSASDAYVAEKSTAVLLLRHTLSDVSIIHVCGSDGIPQRLSTYAKRLKPCPFSSSTSSGLGTRLFCAMYRASFTCTYILHVHSCC